MTDQPETSSHVDFINQLPKLKDHRGRALNYAGAGLGYDKSNPALDVPTRAPKPGTIETWTPEFADTVCPDAFKVLWKCIREYPHWARPWVIRVSYAAQLEAGARLQPAASQLQQMKAGRQLIQSILTNNGAKVVDWDLQPIPPHGWACYLPDQPGGPTTHTAVDLSSLGT